LPSVGRTRFALPQRRNADPSGVGGHALRSRVVERAGAHSSVRRHRQKSATRILGLFVRLPRTAAFGALALLVPLVASAGTPGQEGVLPNEDQPLRLLMQGGESFGGRTWESSAFGSMALARDFLLAAGSRFAVSTELYPVFVVRQRQLDRTSSESKVASALAGLLVYRGGTLGPGWGYRVEVGTGLLYPWNGAVPADGTRFNFLDQGGASIVYRTSVEWSVGYRLVHVSNANLFGVHRNPGTSFQAVVVSIGWR
jgi:hypothetical protein